MIGVDFEEAGVRDSLLRRAEALRDALEARIGERLSGEVLQSRSGALAGSIISSVAEERSTISVSTSSVGVPYAAIQEFGGKTAAHEIVAIKAKVLAFGAGGGQVFARRAHHPGSVIPGRSYLGGGLSDMRDEIGVGFKEAVLQSLRRA